MTSDAARPAGRIARLEAGVVAIPFTEPETSATVSRHGFENVLVRLETEEGAVGWGEASGASGAPVEAVRATIERLIRHPPMRTWSNRRTRSGRAPRT